ncbi:MAG: hypothetical protein ABW184_17725 [Sphingobium sp.]
MYAVRFDEDLLECTPMASGPMLAVPMAANQITEMTFSEIDLVDGGLDWGAIGNQALGGALAGGIGGAAGGAVTGLMVGGIGAGPGALAGGVGGAIAGGIGGAAVEAWNQLTDHN